MTLRSRLAIIAHEAKTRSAWRQIRVTVDDYHRRRAAHVARRDDAIRRARELEQRLADMPLDERVRISGEMCVLLTQIEADERLLAAEGSYLNAILDGLENGLPAARRDSNHLATTTNGSR